MTGIVDRLVDQQLVERRSNAEDRRKVLVALTDKGQAQLTGARSARRYHLEHAVGQLDEADRHDLVRLLRQFADALGDGYLTLGGDVNGHRRLLVLLRVGW